MPSVKILVAACLFAALAPAQDKTRDLPREGISFTLPGAWKWQSDFGSNLAIRMDVDAKGVKYELVGELLSSDTGTVDDEILALEAKVKEGGPDFRDFTVDRNAMLGGQKAVMVRFARLRNEGKDVSEERVFLQRRGGLLLRWKEENRREVAAAAGSAFAAARGAMRFRENTLPKIDPVRQWKDIPLKLTLPEAWKWEGERQEPSESTNATLSVMVGEVSTKKGAGIVQASLSGQKYAGTLAQFFEGNRETLTSGVDAASNVELDPKATWKGEKAVAVAFVGTPKNGNKIVIRRWFFKRKGFLFNYQLVGPSGGDPSVAAAMKRAEAALGL